MPTFARTARASLVAAFLVGAAAPPASAQLLSGLLGGSDDASSLLGLSLGLGDILSPIGGVVESILNPEGEPGGGALGPIGSPLGNGVLDHDAAIAAVRENRALPLDLVLPMVQRVVSGTIIDVRLIQSRQILYYEVKLIAAGGVVYLAYFDAMTGAFVPQG